VTTSTPSRKVAGFGRGAASFLALPISLLRIGIRYAAVLPDPALEASVLHRRLGLAMFIGSTCLSDPDNIMTLKHGWDGVLLDGRGSVISHHLDVLGHDGMECSIPESAQRLDPHRTFLLDANLLDPVDVRKSQSSIQR
jgi:hypothetical protein